VPLSYRRLIPRVIAGSAIVALWSNETVYFDLALLDNTLRDNVAVAY
jgi:hypothetical protein